MQHAGGTPSIITMDNSSFLEADQAKIWTIWPQLTSLPSLPANYQLKINQQAAEDTVEVSLAALLFFSEASMATTSTIYSTWIFIKTARIAIPHSTT